MEGKNVDLKILDKISSKNELIKLTIDEEFVYKDLAIKSMKCTNSEFDDNPEIKAYIQVRDLTKEIITMFLCLMVGCFLQVHP